MLILDCLEHIQDDAFSPTGQLTRSLLVGISPDEELAGRKMSEVLGIRPSALRKPGTIDVDRYSISESLGLSERGRIIAQEGGLLSAFQDGAFSAMFSGWELHEYRDRISHFARVEKSRLDWRAELEAAPDELGQNRLKIAYFQLDKIASTPAKERPRTWPEWW